MAALTPSTLERDKNFPFNFMVNVLDGGFFGFGIGFASFSTIIPLFVSTMTSSAILIGLIPAVHVVGWQLPQLFTAHRVAQQKRYKPMTMFYTIQERLPYLGLAIIAWFVPHIGPKVALILTFLLLVWQGLGAGFTATAWQSMIGKIIPGDRWGLFFGFQSAAANLLASVSAVIAGIVLERNEPSSGFSMCFLFASGALVLSYIAISLTREGDVTHITYSAERGVFWRNLGQILKRDINFRWFVVVRILAQMGTMGFAFYIVYAVRYYGVEESTAGILTGVLMIVQTAANPIMGWLGDRWSHRGVMAVGLIAAALSAVIALWAPSVGWFYLVFSLAGIANVAVWTIYMAMTLEFGREEERPAYIGLVNTLAAPTAFIIPLFGGWLADYAGYHATFIASSVGALATVFVLGFMLRDQRKIVPVEE